MKDYHAPVPVQCIQFGKLNEADMNSKSCTCLVQVRVGDRDRLPRVARLNSFAEK